jgi:hypothetical protein
MDALRFVLGEEVANSRKMGSRKPAEVENVRENVREEQQGRRYAFKADSASIGRRVDADRGFDSRQSIRG